MTKAGLNYQTFLLPLAWKFCTHPMENSLISRNIHGFRSDFVRIQIQISCNWFFNRSTSIQSSHCSCIRNAVHREVLDSLLKLTLWQSKGLTTKVPEISSENVAFSKPQGWLLALRLAYLQSHDVHIPDSSPYVAPLLMKMTHFLVRLVRTN
jgi:hypothetical protein